MRLPKGGDCSRRLAQTVSEQAPPGGPVSLAVTARGAGGVTHVEPHPAVANSLLGSLTRKDRRNLLAIGELVNLEFGDVLCEPGAPIRYAYFPIDCFISLVIPVDSGASLEVELVGSEGVAGIPLLLGVGVSALRVLAQGAGRALRISAPLFQREVEDNPALREILLRYVFVLLAQLAQTAACNRFHLLDARLARWLLMTSDRAHSNEFHLTHETLARMLGVRRVGVTNAAGKLQKRKLVSYTRGDIRILDRPGLEAASCDCYQVIRDTYTRVLG